MQKDETKKIKWARSLLLIFVVATFPFVMVYVAFSSTQGEKTTNNKNQNQQNTITIGATKINVLVARSDTEKQRGLCCRDLLPQNEGMVFIYDAPGNYRFWMKDTRIPLDMYWLNTEKKIIHIEQNVQPKSYPKSFGPAEESQYILETNAGFAKAYNITVGDHATFQLQQ